jgi:putative SOS response-associated peptidase YedK
MTWDGLGDYASWKTANVRNLTLRQSRNFASRPDTRCVVPLIEFREFTPDKHNLEGGKPPLKGEMWFQVVDQLVFAVAAAHEGRRRLHSSHL